MSSRKDNHGYPVFHDAAHHLIHLGRMFDASDEVLGAAISSNNYYLIKVDSFIPHVAVFVSANQEIGVYLYRSPTVTADGTEILSLNLNDNANYRPLTTRIFKAPTISATGTLIKPVRTGLTNKASGNARTNTEIILRKNTNYLLNIVPVANGTNFTVEIEFYEDEK